MLALAAIHPRQRLRVQARFLLGFRKRYRFLTRMTTAHNNRAFLAQDLLDTWLAEERVSLDGEVLKLLPQGPAFVLTSAVLFQAEVATGEDPLDLCGKVKPLQKVAELGGEHVPGSVVIGDNAYEVCDGFLGELLAEHPDNPPGVPSGIEHGRWALRELESLKREVEVG